MDESELGDQFVMELRKLEAFGADLPFCFRASEAWYLFSLLRLALQHPVFLVPGSAAAEFGQRLAAEIERRMGAR